jgi:hypothetical protein
LNDKEAAIFSVIQNPRQESNDKTSGADGGKPPSFWEFLRRRNPHIFAHHPDHPAFRNHVWVFRGLYFCKGCVMTFSGMIFGAVLYPFTGWLRGLTVIQTGLIFLAMLLPTLMTSLLPSPPVTKHIARFLLGILVASAVIMLFITDSWPVRIGIVLTYLAVRIPMEKKRRRDNDALVRVHLLQNVDLKQSDRIHS